MTWTKGRSGNPGGAKPNAIKLLARKSAPAAFKKLVKLSESDDERVRLDAVREIINRAWGKPAQALIGGDDDDPAIKTQTETIVRPV